jgi:hypothetical protein
LVASVGNFYFVLFFVHAMKVQAEEKACLHLFLTSALNTDWCLPSRTALLTMAENPLLRTDYEVTLSLGPVYTLWSKNNPFSLSA